MLRLQIRINERMERINGKNQGKHKEINQLINERIYPRLYKERRKRAVHIRCKSKPYPTCGIFTWALMSWAFLRLAILYTPPQIDVVRQKTSIC